MLDLSTRTAVLRLHEEGHSRRKIAQALRISRRSVMLVLRSGTAAVPVLLRASSLDGHEDRVKELFLRCAGNRVRVHEELEREGVAVSYGTVTRMCRELELGVTPKKRVGRYVHEPGAEMEHDTSPHHVRIGERVLPLQCASLILPYSSYRFAQVYERWTRLQCRQFLQDGVRFFGGSAGRCVVDNSSIVLRRGSGKDAEPAAEMLAMGRHFGFEWLAHGLNDPNRKAGVEKGFDYIEQNFYAGRTFVSIEDCNAQLRQWCEQRLQKTHPRGEPSAVVLWAEEQPRLRPLPIFIPPIYVCHERKVNVESYVSLESNLYPVREKWIGKTVEIREELTRIVIHDGHTVIAEYPKFPSAARQRVPWPRAWESRKRNPDSMCEEEASLRRVAPELGALVDALRKRYGGQGRTGMKRLFRLWKDYPSEAVVAAAKDAVQYGMTDLDRLEAMVLRRVGTDYFNLSEADDG